MAKNPGVIARMGGVCEEWLLTITESTLRSWLRDTGSPRRYSYEPIRNPDAMPSKYDSGLFLHELRWLQEHYPVEELRQLARDTEQRWRRDFTQQAKDREAKAAKDAKKQAEREKRAEDREIRIEARRRAMAESIAAYKEQFPGDVRKASNRAAALYLGSPVPRTLKQCLAIAADEGEVAFGAISSYLAGVGVRALFAESGAEVKEPEWDQV